VAEQDTGSKTTPMMAQYEEAKAAHPDAILFFRMGDFYEMFRDDAVVASRILGLTLTSRSKGDDAIPMAGVPYHAAEKYMAKLIAAGHRVAVCDQMADPASVKGLVPREVTRVVTPGTLTEESGLERSAHNYLAAACVRTDGAGLACIDLSTGEFFLEETAPGALPEALERLQPAECLVPEREAAREDGPYAALTQREVGRLTRHPDSDFAAANAARLLQAHYGVESLDGFGLDAAAPAVGAAAAALRYLHETQRGNIRHLHPPRRLEPSEYLTLDRTTIRNLELVVPLIGEDKGATLYAVVNRTVTAPGARLLRGWLLRPLARREAIRTRQAAVGELLEDHLRRGELRETLRRTSDVERIIGRVGVGRASPRDLASLGATLALLPALAESLEGVQSALLQEEAARLTGLEELAALLERALVEEPPASAADGGVFRRGYHAELDELREVRSGGQDWIARFQAREAERTGVQSLKVKFNKVFGYYIEITKANLDAVPEEYERKQTLVNAERFITPELKEYEEKVLGAAERIAALEQQLFRDLREEVAAHTAAVQAVGRALARIDTVAGLAELGAAEAYCLPELDESRVLQVEEGRHPVLEARLPAGEFVPNDLQMEPETSRVIVITGPNMAGKSTYIRQCALLLLLAQMGAPIPARRARLGLVDRIFTRVGAADDLARGQSTFMVEMNEAANILNNATERSFIVLDEVGRGTSTFDGVSLAWALTEHLHNHVGARCLFATHYHELAELGLILPGAANYNVAVRDWGGDVIFLHRIQPGSADRSYGIHVARLAGVPHPVIERAKGILEALEAQAQERDRSILGETEALRAAAREVQLTLFDDPDRDALCREVAALEPETLTRDEALEILTRLARKARPWRQT
jgi:DNA mismatch repair protein MutS